MTQSIRRLSLFMRSATQSHRFRLRHQCSDPLLRGGLPLVSVSRDGPSVQPETAVEAPQARDSQPRDLKLKERI